MQWKSSKAVLFAPVFTQETRTPQHILKIVMKPEPILLKTLASTKVDY